MTWQSSLLSYPMSDESTHGKQVWQEYNCISCHALFGNGGYSADDMTHIVGKRSTQEIITFLVDPPVMRPNHKRRHPKVSKVEAQKLVEYFILLDKIPTLGWPPTAQEPGEST